MCSPLTEAELLIIPTQTRKKRVCVSYTGEGVIEGQEAEEINDFCNEGEVYLRDRADQIIADALGEDSDHDPDYKPKGIKENEKDFIVGKKRKRKSVKIKNSTVRKIRVPLDATLTSSTTGRNKNQNMDLGLDFEIGKEFRDEGERPVSITSPDQINSMIDHQKGELMTSSSFNNVPEENVKTPNIMKTLGVQDSLAQILTSSSTQSELPVKSMIISPPQATRTPGKQDGKVFNTVMPPRPLQPLPGHLHPGHPQSIRLVSRHGQGDGLRGPYPPASVRGKYHASGGPVTFTGISSKVRMQSSRLNQRKPVLPRYPGIMSQHRLGLLRKPGPHARGNNPNATSHHLGKTIKHHPPVIELDSSPPRAEHVVAKQTSLDSSLVTVPGHSSSIPDMVRPLPPNISITRTSSSNRTVTTDQTPPAPLISLARALEKMGETEGSRRLVRFELTESQIQGLRALGIGSIGEETL